MITRIKQLIGWPPHSPKKFFAKNVLLPLLFLVFLVLLSRAWFTHIEQSVTCVQRLDESDKKFEGYLEIQFREQHPIEPTFNGKLFFYSHFPDDARFSAVTVTRSADLTYLPSTVSAKLKTTTQTERNGTPITVTRFTQFKDIGLVAESRLHRFFPFDSAKFDFELSLDPPLHFNVIRLTNRVPGFVSRCDTLQARYTSEGKIAISYKLDRSPLIQLSALVLMIAALVFLVVILGQEINERLATSVASYFFSLWSIRGIFSKEMNIFPTLFDCGFITLAVLFAVLVIGKVFLHGLNDPDVEI